jgi:hypothetical protein
VATFLDVVGVVVVVVAIVGVVVVVVGVGGGDVGSVVENHIVSTFQQS